MANKELLLAEETDMQPEGRENEQRSNNDQHDQKPKVPINREIGIASGQKNPRNRREDDTKAVEYPKADETFPHILVHATSPYSSGYERNLVMGKDNHRAAITTITVTIM